MAKGSGEDPKSRGEGTRQRSWRQFICLGAGPKRRHRIGPAGEELSGGLMRPLHCMKRTNDDEFDFPNVFKPREK